jgi:hypothetical protein
LFGWCKSNFDGHRIDLEHMRYIAICWDIGKKNLRCEQGNRVNREVLPLPLQERETKTIHPIALGVHPAGLNICDCFAYALAKELDCPLLFVGDDFSRTDVVPAPG